MNDIFDGFSDLNYKAKLGTIFFSVGKVFGILTIPSMFWHKPLAAVFGVICAGCIYTCIGVLIWEEFEKEI